MPGPLFVMLFSRRMTGVALQMGVLAFALLISIHSFYPGWRDAGDVLAMGAHSGHYSDLEPSTHWGTYRGNVYFGMRAREPLSILTGLMWYGLGQKGTLCLRGGRLPSPCSEALL